MCIEMYDILNHNIQREANHLMGIKWYLSVQVSLFKRQIGEEDTWVYPVFRSSTKATHWNEDDIPIEESVEQINEKMELFCNLGSGWIFDRVLKIDLYIAQYNPLSGSSYIPTPKKLEHKKVSSSILNIKNLYDEECFMYCILAGIYNLNDENVESYLNLNHEIDFKSLKFPMQVKQIGTFENRNPKISVSVFGYEENTIYPLYISVNLDRKYHIDLLLITLEESSHFLLIRNKNTLFKHILYPKSHHEVHICDYCLNNLSSKQAHDNHVVRCKLVTPQHIKYPTSEENILKFSNFHTKIKQPITVYGDFETMCVDGKLIPTSYAYVIIDDTQTPIGFRAFRDSENVVKHFLSQLLRDINELENSRINYEHINWTPEDRETYANATHCHICEEIFDLSITNSDDPKAKVADHYHYKYKVNHNKVSKYNKPGKLRGAAHRVCNASFHKKFRVPVVFHNLKNFDGHLIISEIADFMRNSNLKFNCIPQTIEKYSTFSLGKLDFIDSLQFLNASLDSLVSLLEPEQMSITKHYFPQSEKFELLCRKGVYPYEYIDSYDKLEKVTSLPPKENFYSSLTETHINDEDYLHAQNVWNIFECKTLGDYQDLYNRADVLQLADIFENFRNTMLNHYGLDICNFVSLAQVSWTAMLKMTKVQLELITDPDIYLLFEQGIRGGVAVIPTRYAKIDPNETALLYLDCNNLYGAALSSYLPIGGFSFVSEDLIDKVLETHDESDIGFICEVDLHVPENLHDYMNDFPLAPTCEKVQSKKISPYQKHLLQDLNINHYPAKKLLTTLEPKMNYIVHYRNLKLYLELGMVLTKIHKIVQFNQSPWMKTYIDFNTAKRASADTKFSQELFKLASNAAFGRTLLNSKRYKNFRLFVDEKKAKTQVCKPTFKQFAIFNKDLVGVLYNKTVITLKSPIYAGMVTLEISKLIMYEYFYKILKVKYGEDRMRLCMSDTDSLLLHLKTNSLYEDMYSIIDTLDTSNYPPNHPLYSEKWKKIVGKFKDESPADLITEFVGLRAKMYTFSTINSHMKCVGKGIPRANINRLNLEDYKRCLMYKTVSHTRFNNILSRNHTLQVQAQSKLALSPYDDKRYLLRDGINTLAYGHFKIKELENE
uniref:DNA-directed DNA polymerase n=1 Tax=Cacopsylla melanoneura TaxID=428564 RepID=A0A8D8TAN0_9HEMI